MRVLLIVIDGMGDFSHPALAWSTPLQAAPTPALDRMAREGCCALMYPLDPGICPSSEVAHWAMFGYRPEEFPGRAFFHARAAGLPLREGDALFMLNLVPVERRREGTFVLDRGSVPVEDICARWEDRLRELAPAGMRLYYMGGIEFIAVLDGGSHRLLPTDPFLHHLPVGALAPATGWEGDREAVSTASQLTAFFEVACRELEGEAARGDDALGLIMKWPSRAMGVEPFEERHGLRAAAVVSTPCFQGMGAALSMHVETVRDEEAGAEMACKLGKAGDLFEQGYGFVFLHTKHADEAAHSGDPQAKAQVIASIDAALSSRLLLDDPALLVVVTADHSTPTARDGKVIHGGDPVPVLFHGVTVRRDEVERFDELSAARGGMGQIAGKDLMPFMLYLSRNARFYTG